MVPFNLVAAGSNMPETGGSITPEGDTAQLRDSGPGVCAVQAPLRTRTQRPRRSARRERPADRQMQPEDQQGHGEDAGTGERANRIALG